MQNSSDAPTHAKTNNALFLHCTNCFIGFGPKRLSLLEQFFPTWEEAFHAPLSALQAAGIPELVAEKFIQARSTIHPEAEQEKLAKENITLLTPDEATWPPLLREIPTPPLILYYKGAPPVHQLCIAVVGTRNITTYGRTTIQLLIPPLARAGICIVSGMAFGVDAAAHTTALHNHTPTIAVLGSGLDELSIYPKAHCLLASQILENGGSLLSEHPPRTPAYKQNFIARNRIISGMSHGTLIVECSAQSGSLLTARYALEQNRDVYAVPGSIHSPQSRGTNDLLKQGAIPVTDAQDILTNLGVTPRVEAEPSPNYTLTQLEKEILDILTKTPVHIDTLVTQTNQSAALIHTTLSMLELKGLVENIGASQYIRS